MDFLSTDITNSFFYGYMFSAEGDSSFEGRLQDIANTRGTSMPAADLTQELEKRNINPSSLSKSQLDAIDSLFDVD